MLPVDHLIWAGADLDDGVDAVAKLTGVEPYAGGVHPGGGTRNALLSFGPRCYLEVIAPDPRQEPRGTPAEWMGKLARPGLASWAAGCDDLASLAAPIAKLGLGSTGIVAMSRRTTTGALLRWRVLRLKGHGLGPIVPFFIDWRDSPHPGADHPAGCALRRFELAHPKADAVARIFDALAIEVPVRPGETAALAAAIETPKGEVALDSASPLPPAWRQD